MFKPYENIGFMMLSSASAVIDALGGTTKAAKLFGVLPSAVSNWRLSGFPARLHYRVAKEVEGRGLEISDSIFTEADPSPAQSGAGQG